MNAVGVFAPELLDAVWREIPVEGRAADFKLVDDVADERGVVHGVLEHGHGVPEGPFVRGP